MRFPLESYENRKISRHDDDNGFVSTCRVDDSDDPFETAINHKKFGSKTVVVETYTELELAKKGHKRWVDTYLNNLPETIYDVGTSPFSKICNLFGVSNAIDSQYET